MSSSASSNPASPPPPERPASRSARAFWLRQLHQWHWVSAAVSLVGLILFTVTGFTLNHAAWIAATPRTVERTATLPAPLLARLSEMEADTTAPVPDAVARWARQSLDVSIAGRPTETTAHEVYVALPRPGGDGWITVDRVTGAVLVEQTSQGAIAYLNDLHKGRDTGPAWSLFIDIFALACLVFTLTGLALLALHARRRRFTWPLVGLGLAIPLALVLAFIH